MNVGSVGALAPVPWNGVYCASKAALYAYTDTLRLELSPFGVKAKIIMTGSVVSNQMGTCDEPVELDEESMYYKWLSNFAAHRKEDRRKMCVRPEDYAKEVVDKLLAGESWWRNNWVLWAGGNAGAMRIVSWIAHNWPWDIWGFFMKRHYMLD